MKGPVSGLVNGFAYDDLPANFARFLQRCAVVYLLFLVVLEFSFQFSFFRSVLFYDDARQLRCCLLKCQLCYYVLLAGIMLVTSHVRQRGETSAVRPA
jgi:hypothetical protein